LSEDKKQLYLQRIIDEVNKALSANDPIYATRMRLAELIHETALTQVLVLDGTLGFEPLLHVKGISGELKNHLLEIAEKDDSINKIKFNMTEEVTTAGLMDRILWKYWFNHLYMSAFNVLRIGLNDFDFADPNKDWFRPFYTSMCIYAESIYRNEIGLPSAFGDDDKSGLRPLFHSTWMNLVENGEKDLLWAWERDWMNSSILGPNPYVVLPTE
jgi:hypothetical protein